MRVAPPPERAIGPRLVLNTAVAGLLGLVAGYGLLLLLGAARPRILDQNDVVRATRLPLLAQFPRRPRGAPRLSDESAGLLRTRLEAQHRGPGPLVVLVVSVAEAEEKDGVAVGLAESFARGGARTLLIDADLRAALATSWLEVNATRATPYDDGVLDNPKQVPPPIAVVVEGNRTFDFLPAYAGARHPVDRLARVFRERFPSWTDGYEVLVIDTAPLLPHADALTIATSAKGVVVLCASAGRSARADVEDAVARLEELGTPVLGTVLTNAGPPIRRRARGGGVQPASALTPPTSRRT
jgi:Mrp family chromosome partitioning ATPase